MKRNPVIHPFLIASYPVIALLAHNITEVSLSDAWRPLVFSLLLAAAILLITYAVSREWHKAGLLATLYLFAFFTYSHAYSFLKATPPWIAGLLGRHRYLLPLTIALLIFLTWYILRRVTSARKVTPYLNLVGLTALLIPCFTIVTYQTQKAGKIDNSIAGAEALRLPMDEAPPDVYYIILDAYAREDTLEEVFDYDNRWFLDALEARGFFIASGSRSNYGKTILSLASSLNFDYLQNLIPDLDEESEQRQPLWDLIQENRIRSILDNLGYTSVGFSTGYPPTELSDSDIFYTGGVLDQTLGMKAFNGFERMVIENSGGKILLDAMVALPLFFPDWKYPYDLHRDWILNIFDHLGNLPETDEPKFVFAHIIAPHSPFVFQRDGSPVERAEGSTFGFTFGDGQDLENDVYAARYRDQLHFISVRTLEVIDSILANSKTPPLIIIQADHGPIPEGDALRYDQQRVAILNAYHLPGEGNESLYPTITPVNSFRVVLNRYFSGDFDLLEDRIYFSTSPEIYNFRDVTEKTR
jgi:hypothetical protein